MKVHVLFGQRIEQYAGEYAPECIAVMSEWDLDENPEYLASEKTKADATGEFERTEVIALDVSDKAIMERLRPSTVLIAASVA